MSAVHTPGPWLIAGDGLFVYALNDKGVNAFSAYVMGAHTDDGELRANARLMAAAPDGLEAGVDMLEVVLAAIANGDWKVDGRCDPEMAIRRMQAFIAKATQP